MKNVTVADFPGLIDLVEYEGQSAFLVKKDNETAVMDQVATLDAIYCPPPISSIPWLLPDGKKVMEYLSTDTDKKLYEDLLDFHKGISELPSEEYYDLIVAWDFHTYLFERFEYTPYLYFYAVAERGKSRTGKSITYLAYRGIRTESINEPQIIRLANDYNISLFVDVRDLWKTAEKKSIDEILLGRFEKGSKVPRVMDPGKKAFEGITYFNVFGPTIIATNVKVDEILETRAIEINMPETDRQFSTPVTERAIRPFRERLVAFRARNIDAEIPPASTGVKGRLDNIATPLLQVIRLVHPEREQMFMNLLISIENGRKIERSTSWEAELLKVVIMQECNVDKGLLLTEHIVTSVNAKKQPRYQVTSNRVGRDLVAMGFTKRNASNGNIAIVYDKAVIKRLANRYGVPQPTETTESSEIEFSTEVSENSEDSKSADDSSQGEGIPL